MFSRNPFSITALAAGTVLAGPSGHAQQLATLYSFAGGADGEYPEAGVVVADGAIYGTTYQGGAANLGTAFSIKLKTGVETVIHSFGAGRGSYDGYYPESGFIFRHGNLYGTTSGGGNSTDGTVYQIVVRTGAESVLYSFAGGTDGSVPAAGLIETGGTLYGTTFYGGAAQSGVVFSLDPLTGAEAVLHSFAGGTDGQNPLAPVTETGGILYGTTFSGGGSSYSGTVFKVDPATGAESLLYVFSNSNNGLFPHAGLTSVGGRLFGATSGGGGESNGGVLFTVNPATGGALRVVHDFGQGTDGNAPVAGMLADGGFLYGTTSGGGTAGYGTVFRFDPGNSAELVLWNFAGGAGGADPVGGVVIHDGKLYGTTQFGGASNKGTVFKLKL